MKTDKSPERPFYCLKSTENIVIINLQMTMLYHIKQPYPSAGQCNALNDPKPDKHRH